MHNVVVWNNPSDTLSRETGFHNTDRSSKDTQGPNYPSSKCVSGFLHKKHEKVYQILASVKSNVHDYLETLDVQNILM